MLPAGRLDEVELLTSLPAYQPAASSVHYATSSHSLVLLRIGGIIARNMLS